MTFYDKLTFLCAQSGISKPQLEKNLNLSNGSTTKWKKSLPTADSLIKIADYFGVTVDYLIRNEDEKHIKEPRLKLSKKQLEIAMAFEVLNEKQQNIVLELLKCFKD